MFNKSNVLIAELWVAGMNPAMTEWGHGNPVKLTCLWHDTLRFEFEWGGPETVRRRSSRLRACGIFAAAEGIAAHRLAPSAICQFRCDSFPARERGILGE